jgi:hypothetical protein
MARGQGQWAYIRFVEGMPGRPDQGLPGIEGPVDPDYGVDVGGRPGHLPAWRPGERPGHLPSYGGRPVDPDYGVDEGESIWPRPPGQRPPSVWPRPPGGGLPVDPGWGRPSFPERPSHGLPIWPSIPGRPDNSLPPVEGVEPPPVDPPPGTIWPPLPPNVPVGKAIALVAIAGVGYRYVVVQIEPGHPDQGLPPAPGTPDQSLPPTEPQPRMRRP